MNDMSSFVERSLANVHDAFVPPVQSIMDVDFYKCTMGQVIQKHYPDVEVTFKLIIRDKVVPIMQYLSEKELRDSLDHCMSLRFSRTDLYWLRGIDLYDLYMFGEPYLAFLKGFKLPPYSLNMSTGGIELTFTGPWASVSMWETIALAAISELYYRARLRTMSPKDVSIVYVNAMYELHQKLEKLAAHPKVIFSDFGQRRRHSFLWQQYVLGECKRLLPPEQFTGTSNTWMAFNHDLVPIGTNAHELPMVLTALADSEEGMRDAQYQVLRLWEGQYKQALRIFLPDTYGTDQFLAHVPGDIDLTSWRGMRQDSGDPISEGGKYVNWLHRHHADPKEKLVIFSDGLDVDPMIRYQKFFEGQVQTTNGWGTFLTNDFRKCAPGDALRPFSMVCKVVEANGRPVVKLSNNPEKATGPADVVEHYKRIFGVGQQESLRVVV